MMMNARHKPQRSNKSVTVDLRVFLAAGIEGILVSKRFISAKDAQATGDESTLETARGLSKDASVSARALAGADRVMAFMAEQKDKMASSTQFSRDLAAEFSNARLNGVRSEKAGLVVWALKIFMDSHSHVPTSAPIVMPSREVQCQATRIVALFEKAKAAKLKAPKIRLTAEGVGSVCFSIAGPNSRYAGSILVTDGRPFGENVFYGHITTDGTMVPHRSCSEEVRDLIVALATDPVGVAKAHGHLHGNCCFCGKDLTTRESVAVGYGPICATKFGLPWGEEKASGVVSEDAPPSGEGQGEMSFEPRPYTTDLVYV